METMEQIEQMICTELEELAEKGEMSLSDLDAIYKLIITKEKLLRIEELKEKLGYSEEGSMSMSGDSYRRSGSYRSGVSRSSKSAYGNGSYARRSLRGSYATEDPRGKMQELLRTTDLSEEQRQFIQRAMEM